jgi:hypothetical protein
MKFKSDLLNYHALTFLNNVRGVHEVFDYVEPLP